MTNKTPISAVSASAAISMSFCSFSIIPVHYNILKTADYSPLFLMYVLLFLEICLLALFLAREGVDAVDVAWE